MSKVKFGNNELNLLGKEIKLGDNVEIKACSAGSFQPEILDLKGKYTVIATYPSADTSICDMQIINMAKLSAKYLNFNFIGLSMDLPSALKNYKSCHSLENMKLYSDYQDKQNSLNLGVLIERVNLSARAMFVLDKNSKLIYKQVNEMISNQVDFEKLEQFLTTLI
ncbi:redoxin domain-containing protein [[Mycoplasma] falconis]|uniref:Redoxin domain-containing protein n=1 Tax=[Mycoplasma] falconis TaxID=92403 RepID=A0A501X9Z3_9BACT|nr:redoxin domain-containing protein [[Mycoplasma] falconis]TPE57203.1 redoxin domain-containing protein [[Mycoplasma] falconis]